MTRDVAGAPATPARSTWNSASEVRPDAQFAPTKVRCLRCRWTGWALPQDDGIGGLRDLEGGKRHRPTGTWQVSHCPRCGQSYGETVDP